MQKFKDKMYKYEVAPPAECWKKISTLLDNGTIKNYKSLKKNKLFYSMAVAASVAVLIFSLIFWLNKKDSYKNELASLHQQNPSDNSNKSDAGVTRITVPKINADETGQNKFNLIKESGSDAGKKKYITIAGPQGEVIKISSKAATLIVSTNDQNPGKLIWSAKVERWKDIMKSKSLAASAADFLDIVELTHVLNNE